jgi:hypothetical protein
VKASARHFFDEKTYVLGILEPSKPASPKP